MSVHCASTGQSSNQRSQGKTKGVPTVLQPKLSMGCILLY